jgi:hypothetical protein
MYVEHDAGAVLDKHQASEGRPDPTPPCVKLPQNLPLDLFAFL